MQITAGQDPLVLASEKGQVIRFVESAARSMGRAASGVKAIELARGDRVVAFVVPRRNADLFAVSAEGYTRSIGLDELRVQSRGGKGVRLFPARIPAGPLVGLLDVLPDDALLALTESGELLSVEPGRGEGNGRLARGPQTLPLRGRKLAAVTRAAIRRSPARAGEVQMTLHI